MLPFTVSFTQKSQAEPTETRTGTAHLPAAPGTGAPAPQSSPAEGLTAASPARASEGAAVTTDISGLCTATAEFS